MATPIDDDTLQRLYDGDLSPLEARRVQAEVDRDPAAQRRLRELGALTRMLRESADELGASVQSASLFAAIEAQIAQQPRERLGPRLRVLSSEWLTSRRGALVPLVAAAAVAAAVLVAMLRPSDAVPPSVLVPESTPATAVVAAAVPVKGSRVETVDFGTSTGTVFEIDNQGVAVAVVWINEEDSP